MFKKIFYIIIFSSLFLTGCSTITYYGHSTERHYSQAVNLPADYPTKYLPDGNIWDAIGRDLKFSDKTDLPYVQEQIRWFQQHQDFLNRAIERGAPYIYYIYQETKRRHLPAELVLIPIFESGYSANSRSYANAVGFWQFMPRTAKLFNLKMNRWYDGRCDAIASTNAALKYFTYLNSFFDNNWFLAISAYDAGEGRIQRAILNNQRRGLSTDFWDLDVKQETRVYVPKLLALSAIIRTPERYGVKLLSVNNGPYFEQVEISSQMDLKRVAKLAETDLATIKRLNPAFKRGVTDPDGPHRLLIPKSKVEIFKANLAGAPYVPPYVEPQKTKKVSVSKTTVPKSSLPLKHTVQSGDTLFSIAHKYNTTVDTLRRINGLPSNAIKPHQTLLISTKTNNVDETIIDKSTPATTVNNHPIQKKSKTIRHSPTKSKTSVKVHASKTKVTKSATSSKIASKKLPKKSKTATKPKSSGVKSKKTKK